MSLLFHTEFRSDKYESGFKVAIRCNDGEYLVFDKDALKKCPFIKQESSGLSFDYSSKVLSNLVIWAMQYTPKGKANSPLPKPCLFRDFAYVATDEWDKEYYKVLVSADRLQHYLPTMKAAEEFEMEGLLDFLCEAVGCFLRGHDDEKTNVILGHKESFSISDLDQVSKDYPWFDEAVKPKDQSQKH